MSFDLLATISALFSLVFFVVVRAVHTGSGSHGDILVVLVTWLLLCLLSTTNYSSTVLLKMVDWLTLGGVMVGILN